MTVYKKFNYFCKYFVILTIFVNMVQSELYTSTVDMENILKSEGKLITHLGAFLFKQENHLKYFERIYNDYKMKHNTTFNYIKHHNQSLYYQFLITKRLASLGEWSSIPQLSLEYLNSLDIINRFKKLQKTSNFPKEEDLRGSVNGLIRLQQTYKLNTSDLANGQIKGYQSSNMSISDCYFVGYYAQLNKQHYFSSLWLEQAWNRFQSDQHIRKDLDLEFSILSDLVKSHAYQKNYESAQKINDKILEIYPYDKTALNNRKLFQQKILSGIQSTTKLKQLNEKMMEIKIKNIENPFEHVQDTIMTKQTTFYEDMLYEAVCRGDITPSAKHLSTLRCRYTDNKSSFLKIAPFKLEEVSLDPYIVVYHDVIYDSEIEMIKKLSMPKLKRAEVGDKDQPFNILEQRISKSAFFDDHEHKYIADISKRVTDMTGLSMKSGEALQIVNYGIGGFYNLHFDFAHPGDKLVEQMGWGSRIATVLFYMSDVVLGGATAFPLLKTAVHPKKGTAVFWWNLYKTGERDFRTEHAGCPVLVGNKWVSNKWIHLQEQEFVRPCGIYPDHDLEKAYTIYK